MLSRSQTRRMRMRHTMLWQIHAGSGAAAADPSSLASCTRSTACHPAQRALPPGSSARPPQLRRHGYPSACGQTARSNSTFPRPRGRDRRPERPEYCLNPRIRAPIPPTHQSGSARSPLLIDNWQWQRQWQYCIVAGLHRQWQTGSGSTATVHSTLGRATHLTDRALAGRHG